jgi:hypothetical protein
VAKKKRNEKLIPRSDSRFIDIPSVKNGRPPIYTPLYDRLKVGGEPINFSVSRRQTINKTVHRYNHEKGRGRLTVRVSGEIVSVYRLL